MERKFTRYRYPRNQCSEFWIVVLELSFCCQKERELCYARSFQNCLTHFHSFFCSCLESLGTESYSNVRFWRWWGQLLFILTSEFIRIMVFQSVQWLTSMFCCYSIQICCVLRQAMSASLSLWNQERNLKPNKHFHAQVAVRILSLTLSCHFLIVSTILIWRFQNNKLT